MQKAKLEVSNKWLRLCHGNWNDILRTAAQRWPDMEAVVTDGQRINYRTFLEEVNRLAKGLYAIGIRKGDRVALWMSNRIEWCYCRFAIYKLGAVMVPLNTRYRTADIEYVLNHCDAKALVMEDKFFGTIDVIGMLRKLCPDLITGVPGKLNLAKFPSLRSVICTGEKQEGCFTLQEVLEKGSKIADSEIEVKVHYEDVSHIQYTSGTTGFPKGVLTTP